MQYGISTACFYPEFTETSVMNLIKANITPIEVFLNSFQELTASFAKTLAKQLGKVQVVSVHPFSSEMETMLFFSEYDRRFFDGLELYRRYFEFCQILHAPYLLFHGVYQKAPVNRQKVFERFAYLAECAKAEGVVLLQENVSRCQSKTPNFIREMKAVIGDLACFALDTKQCLRASVSIYDMLDAMGGNLRHVHISDHSALSDCLPPGEGSFDFAEFSRRISHYGFDQTVIIELYRNSYQSAGLLYGSLAKLREKMEACAK